MKFFFDANMSYRLSNMMAALEDKFHDIIHITQDVRFAHYNNLYGNSCPDEEWLEVLGADETNWVVVSGDRRILETPHQRAILIKYDMTFFAVHWGGTIAPDQAWKFVRMWNEVVRLASMPSPALYKINLGSRPYIEVVRSSSGKQKD